MSRKIDAKLTVLVPNLVLTLVASEDGAPCLDCLDYPKHAQSSRSLGGVLPKVLPYDNPDVG